MCTLAHRMGASRRTGEGTRNKMLGLGQPRGSAAGSPRRVGRTWKQGYRERRLPGGQTRRTDFPTW